MLFNANLCDPVPSVFRDLPGPIPNSEYPKLRDFDSRSPFLPVAV